MLASKNVLVTGGAGFIGSTLIKYLLRSSEYRIVNLDKLTYAANLDALRDLDQTKRYEFIHGDIGDADLVADLLRRLQPGAIINVAAESHVDRSIDGPATFVQSNVVGAFTLLDQALAYWRGLATEQQQGFRFLQVSTDEVYGALGASGTFHEGSPYAPNSPYSASKAAADHLVRAYHQTFGLPTLTSISSNNYGPYQLPEKLIPLMILNALRGESLPIYGDGRHVRDWLFVEDHVHGLQRVLEVGQPGEVYHLGGGNEWTNLDVVQRICDLVDRWAPDRLPQPRSSLIEFVADRPGHDRRYALDVSKAKRDLGWVPQISFDTGLERTVQWYIKHADWLRRVQSARYQRQIPTG